MYHCVDGALHPNSNHRNHGRDNSLQRRSKAATFALFDILSRAKNNERYQ